MRNSSNGVISLNINTQFKMLYKSGNSAVRPSLVLYVRKNGLSCNRLGVTVSKKIGKAVVRNRAKRRLRELYRTNLSRLAPGIDAVLVARGRTAFVPYDVLENDFLSGAKELGVLTDG